MGFNTVFVVLSLFAAINQSQASPRPPLQTFTLPPPPAQQAQQSQLKQQAQQAQQSQLKQQAQQPQKPQLKQQAHESQQALTPQQEQQPQLVQQPQQVQQAQQAQQAQKALQSSEVEMSHRSRWPVDGDAAPRRHSAPLPRMPATKMPAQSHMDIVSEEIPGPGEYYPDMAEPVGYMVIPILRSRGYSPMMVGHQQKGLLTNMGNFFSSMFPIEINVPDMFGAMMGYVGNMPMVQRWQHQHANQPRIYLLNVPPVPQYGPSISQNHLNAPQGNRYLTKFRNSLMNQRYPGYRSEEDILREEELKKEEEEKRGREEAEVFSATMKELYHKHLDAQLRNAEEERRQGNQWDYRRSAVEQAGIEELKQEDEEKRGREEAEVFSATMKELYHRHLDAQLRNVDLAEIEALEQEEEVKREREEAEVFSEAMKELYQRRMDAQLMNVGDRNGDE